MDKELINSAIDIFHSPEAGDPTAPLYKEWHYFNFLDEEQGLSYITTFMLNGNVSDPAMSAAANLVSYNTPAGNAVKFDIYPVTAARWSDKSPDVTINNSKISLENDGYRVRTVSQDNMVIFDAIFKPEVEPAPVFNAPLGSVGPGRVMNWITVSSKMTVNGTLTVNKGTPAEKTYAIKNVRGYHDHNWGRWLWSDNMGWDWAQASGRENDRKNSLGKYSISLGRMTDNKHTLSAAAVLHVWENKNIISSFRNGDIKVDNHRESMKILPGYPNNPYPTITDITASSGENNLSVRMITKQVTPILLPLQPEGIKGCQIVWEISGSYEVSGNLNGKPVSFKTDGYLEYVGELMILP